MMPMNGMGGAGSNIAQAIAAARRGARGPSMAEGGDPLTSDYSGIRRADPIGYSGAQGMAGTQSGPAAKGDMGGRGSFRAHLMRMSPTERESLMRELGFSKKAPIDFLPIIPDSNPSADKFIAGDMPRHTQNAMERAIALAMQERRQKGTMDPAPREGAYGSQSGKADILGMWPGSPYRALYAAHPEDYQNMSAPESPYPVSIEDIAKIERNQQFLSPKTKELASLLNDIFTPNPVEKAHGPERLAKLYDLYDHPNTALGGAKFLRDLIKEAREEMEHREHEQHHTGHEEASDHLSEGEHNPFDLEATLLRLSHEFPPPDIMKMGANMPKRAPVNAAGQNRGGAVSRSSDKKKKAGVVKKALKAAKKTKRVARGK